MHKSGKPVLLLLLMAIGSLLSSGAWAQDAESAEPDEAETEAAADVAADTDEEIVVDDGSYVDTEDDDFDPTEEISSDQSITFPTDI